MTLVTSVDKPYIQAGIITIYTNWPTIACKPCSWGRERPGIRSTAVKSFTPSSLDAGVSWRRRYASCLSKGVAVNDDQSQAERWKSASPFRKVGAIIFLSVCVIYIMNSVFGGAGSGGASDVMADVSGLWRDAAAPDLLFAIDLAGKEKSIKLRAPGEIPTAAALGVTDCELRDYDAADHILRLNCVSLDDKSPVVDTIRQVFTDDGKSFHLTVSGGDRPEDVLSFVRKNLSD